MSWSFFNSVSCVYLAENYERFTSEITSGGKRDGLMKYNKKTMTAVKKVQEVKIVPDRRYRRGYRTDGYMTRTYKYKIPAGVDDIAFYKKKRNKDICHGRCSCIRNDDI